jgi:hypothetical protein
VHGGLPFPPTWLATDIERAINTLPADLPHPALMTLAWDLLWNDVLITCPSNGVDEYGFTYSSERNSSRLFNAHAITQFCSAHNFTHIIRAHQTKLYGSQVRVATRAHANSVCCAGAVRRSSYHAGRNTNTHQLRAS